MTDWGIVITATASVLAAWIAYLGVRSRGRVDHRTASTQTLVDGLAARVDELTSRLEKVEADLAAARAETEAERALRRTAEDAAALLRSQGRDRDELLADLMVLAEWIATGSPPPPPALSWRIQAERAAHAATIARQQTDTKET